MQSRSGHDVTPLSDAKIEELAVGLSPEERHVILHQGTERPFCGLLLDNKQAGTYQCRLCALPLFSSQSKFHSGTGWPSFFQPLDDAVDTTTDRTFFMTRTEVHCARCGGHLGHVFEDGPPPTGLRYCMNGVAMAFKPQQ